MLDYVKTKGRQGIFFNKPAERIQLPEAAELVMRRPEERCGTEADGFYYSFSLFI